MDYKEALDFLFEQLPMYQRIGKAAYKNNLNNTIALDTYFGEPHKAFRTIHVAGTNGKGSVSHMIASVLQRSGYKTGLYTSPHLKDFRERIKINGKEIPQQEVVDFVQKHWEIINEISPSFFEMTVAMAFDYFKRSKVDVAVIEVGMGGRLDSTNIISPDVSVITNIGLDHTQFLGDTLKQIAYEKAGIIKNGIPLVLGEKHDETIDVFKEIAKEKESDLIFAEERFQIDYVMQSIDYKQIFNVKQNNDVIFKDLKLDLSGMYQKKNLITVLSVINRLINQGYKINQTHIYEGLASVVSSTGLKGRWQILEMNPLVVCDTGHNEDGLKQVLAQINQSPFEKLHLVLGMVNDKNIDRMLQLLPKDACYYFVKAQIPRALEANVLSEKASSFGLIGKVAGSVKDGLAEAKKQAGLNDLIFVGGSTFVVAEVV